MTGSTDAVANAGDREREWPAYAHTPEAWNTWDPRFPAAMLHLPTGLAIRLCAYSASANRWTEFRYSSDVRLEGHAFDGSSVELVLPHAGSTVRVRFASPDFGTLVGSIRSDSLAEWGLRFWFLLELGFMDPAAPGSVRLAVPQGARRYTDPPLAVATAAGVVAALTTAEMPVGAHLYEHGADAASELEDEGYYSRPAPRSVGRWAQLRFTAVEPEVLFAAHLATDAAIAEEMARRAAAAADGSLDAARIRAEVGDPVRAAVRDVVAWNTVWDAVNRRPYTVATRAWAPEKFGGWFVWLSDAFYAALLAAYAGSVDIARANVRAALSGATAAGNLPGLLSGRTEWVDRSQLPVGAHAVWVASCLCDEDDLLAEAYAPLVRSFDWWFHARDGNGNGLLEPGSSPVGDGHFVHTRQAALDEAAMDNSAIYDEAVFDPNAHTLDVEDVALNSLLVLEAHTLARMAEAMGRPAEEVESFRRRGQNLATLVRDHLWDPERGVFANRLWSGRFVASLAPTSFYPLTAGIATREQADALVKNHLTDPDEFWGEHPIAGTPFDDPAARDNVYWRGRVWAPMNYLVWLGLLRYEYSAEANELVARGRRMFDRGWAERRCWENLNQRTGEGGDGPDSDPFYTWGALLALIGDGAVADAFRASW